LYFNIIINKGKITLLIDEYVYSYVNEFLKSESIIFHNTDCDRKFLKKIVIIHIYHVQ